ncbi:MAG: DUF1272 domain-containing protein [Actinobacteria bacterium]|jgi:hypothetical protein|nr:DUF1272 domain-containing protein [Actinomycetota bacterium]PLS86455.1 MAG: DUF1272 domain-containing protein [Actinomycetota bacterium]
MSLEMRGGCERCGSVLAHDGPAFICSFECTFCEDCATDMACVCPNCGGELVRRPRRNKKDS